MNAHSWWHDQEWSNRRILWLVALTTLLVSSLWHLPQEFDFLARHTGEIVFALVLALGMTYTLRPAVRATERVLARTTPLRERHQTRRTTATSLVFIGLIAVVWIFSSVGLKPMAGDAQTFWKSFVAQSPTQRQALIEQWESSLNTALTPYRAMLPADATDNIEDAIPNAFLAAKARLSQWLLHSFSHLGFLVELILVPVLVFYFLADGRALRNEIRLVCPRAWRPRVARMMAHLDRVLDGYIRGQVLMCLIAWVLVTAGLWMLGVPHPFMLGILAGLTRAVPIIGPLLGAVPITLVCLIATKSLETTGFVLGGFTAMHFLESKVLLPKIIGHEVDLHPVSVILALLLGMEFFGFIGVFLAVPIAALGKILLCEWQGETHRHQEASCSQTAPEMPGTTAKIPEVSTVLAPLPSSQSSPSTSALSPLPITSSITSTESRNA
jgi:predicted PurR-regulated permease PerM